MMPLSSEDLPEDWVPTTTRRGTSGFWMSPVAPASSPEKMPSRVAAIFSTSALPSALSETSTLPGLPTAPVLMAAVAAILR